MAGEGGSGWTRGSPSPSPSPSPSSGACSSTSSTGDRECVAAAHERYLALYAGLLNADDS